MQAGVDAAAGEQLGVGALLDEAAGVATLMQPPGNYPANVAAVIFAAGTLAYALFSARR